MTVCKMVKINILGLNKHKKKILKLIKQTGIVHFIFKEYDKENSEKNKKLINKEIELNILINKFNEKEKEYKFAKLIQNKKIEKEIEKTKKFFKILEKNNYELNKEKKIKTLIEKIGKINKENIEILKNNNIIIKVLKIEKKKWINIKKELANYKIIENDEKNLFILTINSNINLIECEEINDLLFNDLKKTSFSIKKKVLENIIIKNKVQKYSFLKKKIEKIIKKINNKIILNKIQEKIEIIENNFFLIKGFIPEEEKKTIIDKFINKPVNLNFEKINIYEEAPIKLKNNWFFDCFEFIVNSFSGISYLEKDLTPLIGILFIVFGSMCLLDAGYSILLFVFGLVLLKKKIKIGKIFLITGFFSTIAGTLVGQVFGLIIGKDFFYEKNPLLDFSTNPISYFKFSIFVGIIIMMIAYLSSIYQNGVKNPNLGGFLFSLSFLSLIFNNIFKIYLFKIVFYFFLISSIIFWIAFPEKIFEKKIPNILWTLYSSTTGFIQDVLSHIRLFGISLSGAILAMVINKISENFPIIILIPFSIISHVIIFFLSLLSVYIHSNRLIFLEFGNKCIKGGHFFYKPLK